jgi:two-component system, OmpR family, sensor histidine kinase CreC
MVSIRTRIIAGILLIVAGGFCYLINWVIDEMRPHYMKSMEESLVDESVLLASIVEGMMESNNLLTHDLRSAFDRAGNRELHAEIYDLVKRRMNVRVYITDEKGIVVFDSDGGRDEGKDYSRWNDVHQTLRGVYGARTSHSIPDDQSTSVLYVAAPIMTDTAITGVLTVCKPTHSVTFFIEQARNKIIIAGIFIGLGVVLLGVFLSLWVTSPLRRLTDYARSVSSGKKIPLPKLGLFTRKGTSEVGIMGTALEEMREALEGKKYIEHYVQTLTHEIKSPLSAIRGAAELIDDQMPPEDRAHFLSNIRSEVDRIQHNIDRLLELSSLESRKTLREQKDINLAKLLEEIHRNLTPACESKQIVFSLNCPAPLSIIGEPFLIRQAITNCIQNALDFTPANGSITLSCTQKDHTVAILITDTGAGIPDYAKKKIFDRFYSLNRPDSGKKSSGLGLSFVKEAMVLHGGSVEIENREEGGVQVMLLIPRI